MKKPLTLFTLSFFLMMLAVPVHALQAEATIAVQAETTESVVPELQKIVVLCATEQEKQFKEEWSRYVKHNKLEGDELKKTIRKVSDEAELYRAREKKTSLRTAEGRNWKAEQQKIMKEVAERSSITAR